MESEEPINADMFVSNGKIAEIGKNIKEPKAFGIYKDGRNFIVYKNKANGQRAVRYKGTDEAYAVNELYMRLKEEILNQKSNNLTKRERNVSGSTYDGPTMGKCLIHITNRMIIGVEEQTEVVTEEERKEVSLVL